MSKKERKGCLGPLLFFIFISCVILLAPGYTVGWLGELLVVDDEPQKADAIIVLLSEMAPERAAKAAELYRRGLAKQVVVASGPSLTNMYPGAPAGFRWPLLSEATGVGLMSAGVPRSAIKVVNAPHVSTTSGELQAIGNLGFSEGWQHVIIVTSASHTLRSSMIWFRTGNGISADIVAARTRNFDQWWSSYPSVKKVIYEYLALVKECFLQVGGIFGRVDRRMDELKQQPQAEPAKVE